MNPLTVLVIPAVLVVGTHAVDLIESKFNCESAMLDVINAQYLRSPEQINLLQDKADKVCRVLHLKAKATANIAAGN